jgi:lysophospholipid acyltransferase (LPLAT)-like uncharacterized protein
VPLTISSARFIALRSWDSKKFPLPFNRITVTVHESILVSQQNFDAIGARIIQALGGPDRAVAA